VAVVNDFDDLDQLERTLGPPLQVALRRVARGITDERRPTRALDLEPSEVTALGTDPSPEAGPRHRWRLVAAGAAAAALLVVGSILVRVVADDGSPGAVRAGPGPVPTTDPTRPSSEQPNAVPPAGARPSTPETGTLLADLPNRPVFVYEDGRVIWPEPIPSQIETWNWFERWLTPDGLELVRAEIRSGGRLDPAAPPPEPSWRHYWDGERELYTEGWPAEAADLSWLPADAWEDPEPTVFVSSRYAVCMGWPGEDPSALLARLPADAVELLAEAPPVAPPPEGGDSICFELAIDDAREVEVALDVAGATRPGTPFFYVIDPHDASMSVAVGFTPYLPHGNPVYVQDIP
jgi:hypothetical protein